MTEMMRLVPFDFVGALSNKESGCVVLDADRAFWIDDNGATAIAILIAHFDCQQQQL